MTLNQFGAVMTFAVELESQLAIFYTKAFAQADNENKAIYSKRAEDATTRQKKLEKSRRENVTEIILEPIEGLNPPKINLESFKPENIAEIEKEVAQFYLQASEKVNVLEAQRVLKKCFKEHKALT